MNLSDILKTKAIEKDLCEEHTNKWHKMDKSELIKYYVKNIDWCIERDYPGKDFIQKNFTQEELNSNGIYIGQCISEINMNSHESLILIDCYGNISFPKHHVCRCYLSHNSTVSLNVTDRCCVFIDMYDDCTISITTIGNARAIVYTYGDNKVTFNENVKIVKKK